MSVNVVELPTHSWSTFRMGTTYATNIVVIRKVVSVQSNIENIERSAPKQLATFFVTA